METAPLTLETWSPLADPFAGAGDPRPMLAPITGAAPVHIATGTRAYSRGSGGSHGERPHRRGVQRGRYRPARRAKGKTSPSGRARLRRKEFV